MRNALKKGFTLLELSIVLVIIGIIIGGILVGQEMLRGSELNSVALDYQRYTTAINSFKDKYRALPGDFDKAASYWPDQCVNAPVGYSCNGDNNGLIQGGNPNMEIFRVWQHLSLAGIVAGDYNLANLLNDPSEVSAPENIGKIAPISKFDNASFGFEYNLDAGAGYMPTYVMMVGAFSDDSTPRGAVFTPQQAQTLDAKMDDGSPNTGAVRGNNGADESFNMVSPTCINGEVYRLNDTGVSCSLIFPQS